MYDLSGHVVTEVSSSGGWNRGEVFAGGHHIATYSGGTSGTISFTHADWLGTERKRTDKNGASIETCTSLPFGDGQSCTGTDVSPLHFTGKQRDTETNNDDFGARYFNSGMARWLTPDWSARPEGVPYATLANPQTLNLYAYVGNNPVTHTDPDGHFSTWARRFGEAIQGKIEESGLEPIPGGNENPEEERTNTQTQPAQQQGQQAQPPQQQQPAPRNSRTDIVLVPTGSGKPEQYTPTEWRMDWVIKNNDKDLSSPGSKYSESAVALSEKVGNAKEWKSGGSEKGGFTDTLSQEHRKILQKFTVDNKQVQIVLGRDSKGNLIKSWYVQVTVHGGMVQPPTYAPSSGP